MLEHWTRALHGQANLASPNFFYPEKGVLGYSDTLLGIGVPLAFSRYLGADRYLAMEYTMMFVTTVGFLGMYCGLRGALPFSRPTALIGPLLFIISNMYYRTGTCALEFRGSCTLVALVHCQIPPNRG